MAGVDLSGRTRGRTALAWLVGAPGEQPQLSDTPREHGFTQKHGDRNLIDALLDRSPTAIALDAPLELPHPVECTEGDCAVCFPESGGSPSYSCRELERRQPWIALSPGMKGPMPSVLLAGISFRAIYLRRALQRHGLRVIETWPMGVYLAPQATGSTTAPTLDNAARRAILAKVVAGLSGPDADGWSTDQLDAVGAAYAGWCWAEGTAHAVTGLEGEGEIWVPGLSAAA